MRMLLGSRLVSIVDRTIVVCRVRLRRPRREAASKRHGETHERKEEDGILGALRDCSLARHSPFLI